ncbi:hypothetical protein HKX48_000519 [Thoreauomyces humboldtii]|nr:hypothetical protein HKX48_000519 [Thoreauomyces humboldtii]
MPLFQRLLDSIEKQDEVNFWRCYDGTVRSGDARALELKTQRRILELFKAGKIVNRKKEATKIKLLDQLWATAQISHERPDAALYQDFIELYALVGSLAGVEKGIAALERTGAPVQSRGVQQWNMVALIRAGKVVEARNIYDEYRLETGDSPKLANKFFRACGHADQETAMLDLFKDLEQYGPAPDSHSYSFVITYYSVRGRMDEAAVWLKKLSSRLFNRPPVTQVFNMVLAGYIRTVQPEPANALLVEMAAAGVAHDWNTNEHVIGIAAIEGDSTRAWRAYASSTNPNPSHVTLEYLARLTGPVTDDDASLDAFRAALAEAGVELTPVILAKLVKGYKQLPDGNSAEAVLEWSHRLGYSVKEHTYNDVLAAHINAGDLASGERFADAMSKAGVPVTEAVWRRLIWSLKEAGQSEDALRVLEDGHERYPFMPRAFVAELQQRFGRKDPLAVRASEVMGDKMAFRSQKPLDH